ncbi:hypothetical protein [Herbaspirillum camelliae]|uniref:hypothetical protein n=1 Tax=Herbaspirillum camelliae TaxID=1892903 RepID=UPI00117A7DE7|nr:hypothetical protein [Herbaspirillum camelliae]
MRQEHKVHKATCKGESLLPLETVIDFWEASIAVLRTGKLDFVKNQRFIILASATIEVNTKARGNGKNHRIESCPVQFILQFQEHVACSLQRRRNKVVNPSANTDIRLRVLNSKFFIGIKKYLVAQALDFDLFVHFSFRFVWLF